MKQIVAVGSRIKGKHKIAVVAPADNETGKKVLKAEWPREKTDGKKGS